MKFSFLFRLPSQGRMEIFDWLGRTVCEIFIVEEKGYFVLPAKKVYWEGAKEDALERLLGFQLSLEEMAHLLGGGWSEPEGAKTRGWIFKRDAQGRIVSGRKEEFRFEVKGVFPGSFIPRHIAFQGDESEGHLKVLSLKFNPSPKEGVFLLDFLERFTPASWEEIEKLLGNEN
ncbi:MAG: hypothetical protein WCC06_04455 [Candidatus Aminicenantales bacterium]